MLDAGGMLRTLGALRKVSGLAADPRVRRGSDTTSRLGRPWGWPTKRRARGGDGRRGGGPRASQRRVHEMGMSNRRLTGGYPGGLARPFERGVGAGTPGSPYTSSRAWRSSPMRGLNLLAPKGGGYPLGWRRPAGFCPWIFMQNG